MPSDTATYTGADDLFVVPLGVTSLDVYCESGNTDIFGASPHPFPPPGSVAGTIAVTPGETLIRRVGGTSLDSFGQHLQPGAWPDGGDGGSLSGDIGQGGAASSSLWRGGTCLFMAGAPGGRPSTRVHFTPQSGIDDERGGAGGSGAATAGDGEDGWPQNDPNSNIQGLGATAAGGPGAGGVSSGTGTNGTAGSGHDGGDGGTGTSTYITAIGLVTLYLCGGGGGGGDSGGGGGGVDQLGFTTPGPIISPFFPAGGGGGGCSYADPSATGVRFSAGALFPQVSVAWVIPPFRGQVHIFDG